MSDPEMERAKDHIETLFEEKALHGERIAVVETASKQIQKSQEDLGETIVGFGSKLDDMIDEINGFPKRNAKSIENIQEDINTHCENQAEDFKTVHIRVNKVQNRIMFWAGGLSVLSFMIILFLAYLQYQQAKKANMIKEPVEVVVEDDE